MPLGKKYQSWSANNKTLIIIMLSLMLQYFQAVSTFTGLRLVILKKQKDDVNKINILMDENKTAMNPPKRYAKGEQVAGKLAN